MSASNWDKRRRLLEAEITHNDSNNKEKFALMQEQTEKIKNFENFVSETVWILQFCEIVKFNKTKAMKGSWQGNSGGIFIQIVTQGMEKFWFTKNFILELVLQKIAKSTAVKIFLLEWKENWWDQNPENLGG